MSDRPTPETDNQIFEAWDDEGHYIAWVVDADFARRLERQRDEWQGAFLLATKRAGDAGELLVELKRHRDEWKSIAKEALMSFRCTQRPEIYPEGHWSRRAQGLLGGHAIAAAKGGHDE